MAGRHRQKLAIERLGIRQPAGLVQADRLLELHLDLVLASAHASRMGVAGKQAKGRGERGVSGRRGQSFRAAWMSSSCGGGRHQHQTRRQRLRSDAATHGSIARLTGRHRMLCTRPAYFLGGV